MKALARSTASTITDQNVDGDQLIGAFVIHNDQFSELSQQMLAETLAATLMQYSANLHGYFDVAVDYPTILDALVIDVLSIGEPVLGETKFTYTVNGGAPLEGNLTYMFGCIISL